jgi:heat shock protein HtpX
MTNGVKTVFLLSLMSVLLWQASAYMFPNGGAAIGIGLAFALNIGAYFFSDKLALKASRARPVTEQELPDVYRIMRTLTDRLQIPMPRIFLIDAPQPNAFATGRNPKHAVVAVTTGILSVLNQDELEGVLAHELAHVTNRDILISSVAAMLGAALSILARMSLWGGGGRRRGNNGGGAVIAIVGMLVGPLLAALLRFAISRSREFQADASGAAYTGNPLALASALRKIAGGVDQQPMRVNEAVAPMYIENPLRGPRQKGNGSVKKLFSTHPPMEERVKRLESMVGPLR